MLLLSMPWAALGEPSLGLAILKASLARAGIPTRVRHLNLFLLRHLKARTYVGLANAYALNDFVFTGGIDPHVSGLQRRILRARLTALDRQGILRLPASGPDEAVSLLLETRAGVFRDWLDECAAFVAREKPTMVGLTCLFDQTVASVALARLIRQRLPETTIVLGGYALEGPTGPELLRCFPWIDAVCSGEGEPAVIELAQASVGHRPLSDIPNVLTRGDVQVPIRAPASGLARRTEVSLRAAPVDLDTVPVPDFTDYFADLKELEAVHKVRVEVDTLPVEASRGCWWGQRSHCVFCGIDDETLLYRARSADSTLDMLDELHRRHGISSFRFSDYILPNQYFKTLLPRLAERRAPYRLECEIKSNLDSERMDALVSAGFREVQPGIESFSTPTLRKMAKGVTGIRNVQTLVLGRMRGVRIHWNLLYGFPTDEQEDYEQLVAMVPLLYHLDPPHGCQPVEVTRFAPLQADPARFGISAARHARQYDMMFSPRFLAGSGLDLDAYAYYFERTFTPSRGLRRVYSQLDLQVAHWKKIQVERPVVLTVEQTPEGYQVADGRYSDEPAVTRLDLNEGRLLEAVSGRQLTLSQASARAGLATSVTRTALDLLCEMRLVFREGKRYLGLAIPVTPEDTEEQPLTRKWVPA